MADNGQSEKDSDPHYDKAGPTLLSQQPSDPEPIKRSREEIKKWNILRGHLESRLVMLRQWRNSWWTQNWSSLAQYIEPRRSIWLTQSTGGIPTPNNMSRGRPINSAIVDPTATFATRVCSAGIMSGLASPSRPWFKISPSLKGIQLDSEGRAWLDEVEDRIYTVLAGSNFYNSFAQECEDLVVFGTAPIIIYEDEKDVIRCYNPAVGEYYLSSGATLRVDGLYRTFVMTISQIIDFFGADNCPEDVIKMWEAKGSSLEVERIIAHSIEPNYEVVTDGAGKLPGKFTWREVYWVYGAGSEGPLSMRGFVDQPFTAGRWATQSNDSYGRSPGMDVLPDVMQLQVETMRKAEGIEKQVRPPLLADMQLKNQPSSILPGHVTYVANLGPSTGMKPIYEVNPDLGALAADIAQIQQRIKVGLFNDVILMLSSNPGDRRTTVEIFALQAERLQVLGPVVENVINESLKPRLKRIFGIMKRRGLIPPPPKSMAGIPIDIEFVSVLAAAQKGASTAGIERILQLVGNITAVYPQAADNLDIDSIVSQMNTLLDNPEKILNGPEKIQSIRQGRQQAQQQQSNAAMAEHSANTINTATDAAANLSNVNVGGGISALQMMLGQGPNK